MLFRSNGFSLTGYTFAGWSTSANKTKVYTGGALVSKLTADNNDTVTLYAVWTANTYTIEYNGNKPDTASHAVSGSTANSSHTYDVSKALTTNGYSLEGWTFNGWNTVADGSGASYTNGQSVSNLASANGATVELFAQWTENKYNIVFNNNSGQYSGTHSGSTAGINNVSYESSVPLTANGFSLTGYTFAGWSTSANKTKVYNGGALVSKLTDRKSVV